MQVTATPAPRPRSSSRSRSPPSASTGPSTTPSGASRSGPASPASVRARRRAPSSRPYLGPGAVLDEAVDHLVQDAYRDALIEQDDPAPHERRRRGRPGRGGQAAHLQGDRPGPPRGRARRLQELQLQARDRDHRRRPGRPGHRGAARPERDPRRRSRIAARRTATTRSSRSSGTRDGEPFEGGSSERMPLILGQERLIPGFEANLVGLEVGGSTEFDITFPDDYPETELAGKAGPFRGRAARAPREGPARPRRRLRRRRSATSPTSTRCGRRQGAARAERPRPGPPRLRRPDHRVRGRQRDARAAGRPGRPGGRGDARRVPRLARPAGHHRGGLPQGPRQDRRRPPRRVPAGRREAGQGPCSSCRRSPTPRA